MSFFYFLNSFPLIKQNMNQNVSIIGVGRLGICAALVFEKAGFNVIGVDIFPQYINAINNKTLKSSEPKVEQYLSESKNFKATLSIDEALDHSDIIFVFVATPTGSSEDNIYDHSTLSKILCQINDGKVKNKIISIGCTVSPGYITDVAQYLIRDCENCDIIYNPEFIKQGDIIDGFLNPDLVLIGSSNQTAAETVKEIYAKCCANEPKYCLVDIESATIAKLSINCFITTKIAFCNMVSDIANKTPNANDKEILKTVGCDSRIGSKCLLPGFGYGGPCLARDNRALGYYAKTKGVTPFIPIATDNSNNFHTKHQSENIKKILQDKKITNVIFNDVKYRPKSVVPIIEESQPLRIASVLSDEGFNVTINESSDVIKEVIKKYGGKFTYTNNILVSTKNMSNVYEIN